jgi:hypothetical protein
MTRSYERFKQAHHEAKGRWLVYDCANQWLALDQPCPDCLTRWQVNLAVKEIDDSVQGYEFILELARSAPVYMRRYEYVVERILL